MLPGAAASPVPSEGTGNPSPPIPPHPHPIRANRAPMLSALLLALPAHSTTVDVDALTSFPTTVVVRTTLAGRARPSV